MRVMFDVKCVDCNMFEEVLLDRDDVIPKCKCGGDRVVAITKAASFHLKGGKNNGYYDDGRINTGHEGLRRTSPK